MNEVPLNQNKEQIKPIAQYTGAEDGGVHLGHIENHLGIDHSLPKAIGGANEHLRNNHDDERK
jgi:hypothetical protein